MTVLISFLKSTILSKVVMALTGAVLLIYVIGHLVGNLQIFMGQAQLNHYAEFLHSTGPGLLIARIVLLACLVLHVVTSINLKKLNMDARPVRYEVKNTVKATLASRTMLWTGSMIFFFVTYHVLHLTLGAVQPDSFKDLLMDPEGLPDVYTMTVIGFQNVLISGVYIIALLLLGFHLMHAIPSFFQTLGINHPVYTPLINTTGVVLSILIILGYIIIPIAVLAGFVALPGGGA